MARFALAFVMLIGLCSNAEAQAESNAIDSLKTLLVKDHDATQHIRLLEELSVAYMHVNIDSARSYSREVIVMENEHPFPEMRVQALNTLGLSFGATRQYDSAFYFYDKSLQFAKASALPVLEVIVTNNIGLAHMNQGVRDKAQQHFEAGYELASVLLEDGVEEQYEITLKRGLAGNRFNLGMLVFYEGDYALSLEYFQESLRIYKQVGDQQGQVQVYRQMGLVLNRIGNYEEARKMYNGGLALATERADHSMQILLQLSLSSVNRNLMDYVQASENLKAAKALLDEHPQQGLMITYHTQQSQLHLAKDEFQEALQQLDIAKEIATETNNKSRISKMYLHYAEAHLGLGQFPEARVNLAAAEAVFQKSKGKERYATTLQLWIEYYTAVNSPDSALSYAKEYIALKDSLVPKATMNQISVMYARFYGEEQEHALELSKKNEEIKAKQFETERIKGEKLTAQRNYLIGGAVLLLLLSYVTYRWYTMRRKAETQKLLTELELKALRAQMNPHFLFNALNGAQGMINNNELRSANLFLSRCAKLTRAYLEQSEVPTVSLDVELNTIQLYLDLEALRFKFEHEVVVDPNIETDIVEIPSMLIQPYVENAILHGISKLKGGGKLHIELSQVETGVLCVVEDNGVGRKASANKEKTHNSMGMKITESRFRKIQNDDADAIVPKIIDLVHDDGTPAGTRVELVIPVEIIAD